MVTTFPKKKTFPWDKPVTQPTGTPTPTTLKPPTPTDTFKPDFLGIPYGMPLGGTIGMEMGIETGQRLQAEKERIAAAIPLKDEAGQSITYSLFPTDVGLDETVLRSLFKLKYEGQEIIDWEPLVEGVEPTKLSFSADPTTGDVFIFSEGKKVGQVDAKTEKLKLDDEFIFAVQNMYMSKYTGALPVTWPGGQQVPLSYAAKNKLEEFLLKKRYVAGKIQPSIAEEFGIIGAIGAAVLITPQAIQALNQFINTSTTVGKAYIHLSGATVRGLPRPSPSVAGTVAEIRMYKAYQQTAIYRDLQTFLNQAKIDPTKPKYIKVDGELFRAFQFFKYGTPKERLAAQAILDKIRLETVRSFPGAVSKGRAVVPYTPTTTPRVTPPPVTPRPPTPMGVPTGAITAPSVTGVLPTVTGVPPIITEAPTVAMAEWETVTGLRETQPNLSVLNDRELRFQLGKGTEGWNETFYNKIKRGEEVTVYRVVPKDVTEIKIGDRVTHTRESAKLIFKEMYLAEEAHILSIKAKPSDLIAQMPNEFLYIPEVTVPKEGIQVPTRGIPEAVEITTPKGIEPESLAIPEKPPTIPPPVTPTGTALGRSDNEWDGFMADLQSAETVAGIAFRNDAIRKMTENLPGLSGLMGTLNPQVVANTPAKESVIIRYTLRDEGYQKTQGVIAHLNELGIQEKIFGELDPMGLIKEGALKGQTVGDIAQSRPKWEGKLTDKQRFWLDRADTIEKSVTQFLQRNGIDVNLLRLEEGGQFAARRVWAQTLEDGTIVDIAYVGAGPGRPGAKLPLEKHRIFKTEAEAVEAGYRYIPYEEALYLKVSGAYNRVADKEMADWLLTKVPWRTTKAPEELVLAAEKANFQKRHSQMLLAALNRAVRGERIPNVTIRAIATSYPDQAQALKDLIPRIQAGKPTAKEVQNLTKVAKGLVETNKMETYKAVAARARARELAMIPRMGEAIVPAPAFSGKILTGPEAQETARILRESFEPSFSKVLGEVNKLNAVTRYFMLAGDFSPFTIQLLFLFGENPKIYGKAFAGAIRAMLDPKFQAKFLSKHKATIDRHPNLLISKGGGTEFTEAMARGGWLSGKTQFRKEAEPYWKSLSLFLPRAVGKVGATVLTPFQRVFESSLDEAGIYMAEAYEHLATSPENIADIDQFINEFRGLTSSARIGVSGKQRQIETNILLAPRYNRAIAGLLWDLSRGNIRGHLARKSLIKGIMALVAMATAISIARGEDKDEILEHFNPNSSMFFTWDVAGQKIGPGSKIRSLLKLIAQSSANPDELLEFSMDNPALRFVRGNLAPVLGSAIDLITGRSYIGDPTRDGILSFSKEILAGNLLPIWVQSVLLEGGSPGGRTARGFAEFFGGRAYPEPVWDEVGKLRDKYAQQDFGIGYKELNRAQIDKMKENHPDLAELEEEARLESAERGSEFEHGFYLMRQEAIATRDKSLEEAATLLLNGTISKYDYDKDRGYIRPYYSGGMSVLYGLRDLLDPESIRDIQKWLSDNQKPEDKALGAYQEHRASLIEKADLPRDWDEIDKQCEAYLAKLSPKIRDYVEANLSRWINTLPENAKQVELMRLRGIENETWWDDYRGTGEEEQRFPWDVEEPTTPKTQAPLKPGEFPWDK